MVELFENPCAIMKKLKEVKYGEIAIKFSTDEILCKQSDGNYLVIGENKIYPEDSNEFVNILQQGSIIQII